MRAQSDDGGRRVRLRSEARPGREAVREPDVRDRAAARAGGDGPHGDHAVPGERHPGGGVQPEQAGEHRERAAGEQGRHVRELGRGEVRARGRGAPAEGRGVSVYRLERI